MQASEHQRAAQRRANPIPNGVPFNDAVRSWTESVNFFLDGSSDFRRPATQTEVKKAYGKRFKDRKTYDGRSYTDVFFRADDGRWRTHLDTADREYFVHAVSKQRGYGPVPTLGDYRKGGVDSRWGSSPSRGGGTYNINPGWFENLAPSALIAFGQFLLNAKKNPPPKKGDEVGVLTPHGLCNGTVKRLYKSNGKGMVEVATNGGLCNVPIDFVGPVFTIEDPMMAPGIRNPKNGLPPGLEYAHGRIRPTSPAGRALLERSVNPKGAPRELPEGVAEKALGVYEDFSMQPPKKGWEKSQLSMPSKNNPLVWLAKMSEVVYISDKEGDVPNETKKGEIVDGQYYVHTLKPPFPDILMTADGKTLIIPLEWKEKGKKKKSSMRVSDGWLREHDE